MRSGASLLQGIVCCGRCGRQMAVQYHGRKSYPMYRCARHTKTGESEYCCSIPAEGVDRWVEQQILEAMRPIGIEAALGAVEELEKRSSALRQEWENRIEQAEYEATLARRRYEGVDPDNRLVASNLERDWEDKLQEVEKVQKDFAERGAKPPIWISQEDREKVRSLSKDIPRLWRLKSTKQSDRKKVVRILIRDVWLNLEAVNIQGCGMSRRRCAPRPAYDGQFLIRVVNIGNYHIFICVVSCRPYQLPNIKTGRIIASISAISSSYSNFSGAGRYASSISYIIAAINPTFCIILAAITPYAGNHN